MTSFQSGFLSLLLSGLTGSEPVLPEDFSMDDAYRVAEKHQVLPLIYYGAMNHPTLGSHPVMARFFERACTYISHSANQQEKVEEICRRLDKAGVDFMPLKGTILKSFYPSPEMRVMGDADILVRMEDYPTIAPIMRSLPGLAMPESDHEYTWMLPGKVTVELHKRLIPSYNEDYYAYYGDGWRLARPVAEGSHRFEMSREDTLIYLFTHFAKHYRDKGAGVKYVVDFFVYRRACPEIDLKYVEGEMKKLRLWDFYCNVMRLVDVWFEGAPTDEKSDFLTHKIFDDGVFGKEENGIVSTGVKLSKSTGAVKQKRMLQLVFPGYRSMCGKYPVLKKWAILLPIFWIWRILDAVLSHKDRVQRRRRELNQLSDENISAYQRELNYVGLDFNFGEDAPPDEGVHTGASNDTNGESGNA
jgi:hypothetical protein